VTIPVEKRFGKVVDLYDKYRPGYPSTLVDWIASMASLRTRAHVLDVGCGTGISARMFAERGFRVVGIDPNAPMLARARDRGLAPAAASIVYAPGSAEATGQPSHEFDLVYAAQAFHWFATEPTLREWRRVLVRDGWACAFWNLRAPTPAMQEYEALLRAASSEYEQLDRPEATMGRIRAAAITNLRETVLDNAQRFDWEGLRGRAHSSSYVAHGVKDVEGFDRELRAIYDRYVADDGFPFAYRTHVMLFRIR
jgi:ubiquinone/menaquinone biosynthesis C-methylase UbiE